MARVWPHRAQNDSQPSVLGPAYPQGLDAHTLLSLTVSLLLPYSSSGPWGGGGDCRWGVQVPRAAAELVAGPRVL